MPEFQNPYHFVPVSSEAGPGATALDPKRCPVSLPDHVRHDRFPSGVGSARLYSGKLACRLAVEELLAVGTRQTAGEKDHTPRRMELFRLGNRWALPGSSLRGMISSLAEAASNSALRVVTNEKLESAQWPQRGKTPLGTVYQYFEDGLQELLPLQADAQRKRLSVAEQLFGVVETGPGGSAPAKDMPILSLASRVRFSDALASPDFPPEETEIRTTQILDSPKLPSPNFYFDPKGKSDGDFISKASLKPERHAPKGRKFFLHRRLLQDRDWQSQAPGTQPHQKAELRLLKGGQFWFTIAFENLSSVEMQLLCYALRPSDTFRHKLGMGKSLGLGKVRVDPAALVLINRQRRYAMDSLSDPQYHEVWRDSAVAAEQWPSWLPECSTPATSPPAPSPASFRDSYKESVKRPEFAFLGAILQSIELLGDPGRVGDEVHYPQLPNIPRGTPGFEDAHFKWWQGNDRPGAQHQYLRPLTSASTGGFQNIPALDRNPKASLPSPPPALPPVPPAATADLEWVGPVECVYLKKVMGLPPRFEFQVASRNASEKPLKGFLVSNADPARVKSLRERTRIHLRYAMTEGQVAFDFPPVVS